MSRPSMERLVRSQEEPTFLLPTGDCTMQWSRSWPLTGERRRMRCQRAHGVSLRFSSSRSNFIDKLVIGLAALRLWSFYATAGERPHQHDYISYYNQDSQTLDVWRHFAYSHR